MMSFYLILFKLCICLEKRIYDVANEDLPRHQELLEKELPRKAALLRISPGGLLPPDAITRSRVAKSGGIARALNTEGLRSAGKRGGEAVKADYGKSFYQSIGGKGGQSVKEKYGIQFYREIGEKGGAIVKEKYGSSFYRDIGKRGAQKLKERSIT